MNFIDKIECTDKQMELKYCERCGGLFLRLLGASLVYCGACMAHAAELLSTIGRPGRTRSCKRRRLRTPRLHWGKIEPDARIDSLQGSAATGVRP